MSVPSSADRWPFPTDQRSGAQSSGRPQQQPQRAAQAHPHGGTPQGQRVPQGQYPQGQRVPQGQYPQGHYRQGNHPQGEYPQGQHQPRQQAGTRQAPRVTATGEPVPVGRRLLGFLAFLVLTGLSLPVHVMAVFFVYLQFESPGDGGSAVLLITAAFIGSFVALLVTGVLSQIAGGFAGGWRTRAVFALCSAVLSLVLAYVAALTLF